MRKPIRYAIRATYLACCTILLVGTACSRRSPDAPPSGAAPAPAPVAATTVKVERRTLQTQVVQPGEIEAFRRAPIYARVSGYVAKVHVDIGDRVKKGAMLAELTVPEMDADLCQKEAHVVRADAEVKLARETVAVADADHRRHKGQYDRLVKIGKTGVIDDENVAETKHGCDASKARCDMALAQVAVKEAQVIVAKAERDQAKALLGYATIVAPFDGVVTRRSVDPGHFAHPAATGSARGEPLFVVEQTDPVRIFIDVPEGDAGMIAAGTPAKVQVMALRNREFTGTVTRSAWSLDAKTRTLRTEVDLPNDEGLLRPGMYAYVRLSLEHKRVLSVPAAAVVKQGEQTYCFRMENGKAVRFAVRTGARTGQFVELVKKQARPAKPGEEGAWEDFTEQEALIHATGGAPLVDGQPVESVGSK